MIRNLPGILGCLFGGCALLIVLFRTPAGTDPSSESVAEPTRATASSPGDRARSAPRPALDEDPFRRAAIEAAVEEAVEARFADSEWLSAQLVALSEDPKGSATIRKAMTLRNQYHRIDLSGFPTTEGKIDAVLTRFAGQNRYSSPNDLVKQLREMGPGSIDPLMARLESVDSGDWAQQRAIFEALKDRIPEDRRADVIRHFRESGAFVDFIAKYQVTEVEDELMETVSGTREFPNRSAGGSRPRALMEAALRLNPDRAEQALFEHARYGNNPETAVSVLASLPDVDPLPAIEAAIPRISQQYQRAQMVPLALEHGAAGSLELAERALRETSNNQHTNAHVLGAVRRHTGAIGDPEDVADWLAENRERFVWDPTARAYVLP